jgi:tetratricopeptide (TPR) repeat protein
MPLEDLAKRFGKPGDADYHNNLGTAYLGQGRVDDAVREYEEAIRLRPDDATFRCNLAVVWARKGRDEDALREYGCALELDPNDSVTHFNLGNLHAKAGRVDQAIEEYQLAVRIDPGRAEAHYNLANCHWDQGRTDAGARCYETALSLDPAAPAAMLAHTRLGAFCIDAGSLDLAEEHLLAVLARDESDFLANYCLAIVYLTMRGDGVPAWVLPAKALLHARRAWEARSDDDDARRLAQEASMAFERAKPPVPPA